MKWTMMIVVALAATAEAAPPSTMADFETAWQQSVACLYASDASLAPLDPRDALAVADGLDHAFGKPVDKHDRDRSPDPCHVGALAAAAPPAATRLRAAATALAVAWSDAHAKNAYKPDYPAVETFAEALRDVDDARAAAGSTIARLGTQRVPLAHVDTTRALAPDAAAFGDRIEDVLDGDTELDNQHARVLDANDVVTELDEGRGFEEERILGTGRARTRLRIGGNAGDGSSIEVAESHDGGTTWKTTIKEKRHRVLKGSPRGYDFILDKPQPRWFHIAPDGTIARPVTLPATMVKGDEWGSSGCATADVVWMSLPGKKLAWFERSGKHGEVTGTGDGNLSCAGKAAMKDFDHQRCTTAAAACEPQVKLDYETTNVPGAFASDGVVLARGAGQIAVIVRSGPHAATTRVRLPAGVTYIGMVVRDDAPRLIVIADDGKVRFATLP